MDANTKAVPQWSDIVKLVDEKAGKTKYNNLGVSAVDAPVGGARVSEIKDAATPPTGNVQLPESLVNNKYMRTRLTVSKKLLASFAGAEDGDIWTKFKVGFDPAAGLHDGAADADRDVVRAAYSSSRRFLGSVGHLDATPIGSGNAVYGSVGSGEDGGAEAPMEGMFGARADDFRPTRRRRLEEELFQNMYSADDQERARRLQEDMGAVKFSSTFKERWLDVCNFESDPVRRAVKLSFLGMPASYHSLQSIINNDDVFPFGFLLFRPFMTYSMASAILTVAGSGTGETLVGHADFQLADNVVQKMHVGNFTMYLKSVVYQPQKVWIADNVMASGYVGGDNCEFFPGKSHPPTDTNSPSIIACLVPYDTAQGGDANWEQELPNPLDITGQYSANPTLASLAASTNRRHYATSEFYKHLHAWQNEMEGSVDADNQGLYNRYNTLCFQGHQSMFNPTSHRFDLVIQNSGHKGERIYPGCGKVWKGLAKALTPVNYNTAFGGTPNHTITTISG